MCQLLIAWLTVLTVDVTLQHGSPQMQDGRHGGGCRNTLTDREHSKY